MHAYLSKQQIYVLHVYLFRVMLIISLNCREIISIQWWSSLVITGNSHLEQVFLTYCR